MLVFFIVFQSSTAFGSEKEYHYTYSHLDDSRLCIMTVNDVNNRTQVSFRNELDELHVSDIDEYGKTIRVVIIDGQGNLKESIVFDYDDYRIQSNRSNQKSFRLKKNIYVNSGTLFYRLGIMIGEGLDSYKIKLIQPDNRIVDMYFKRIDTEEIAIGDNPIASIKYEMGLIGLKSIFWPYKYYYWFSADENLLIKYQGISAEKDLVTLQLTGL